MEMGVHSDYVSSVYATLRLPTPLTVTKWGPTSEMVEASQGDIMLGGDKGVFRGGAARAQESVSFVDAQVLVTLQVRYMVGTMTGGSEHSAVGFEGCRHFGPDASSQCQVHLLWGQIARNFEARAEQKKILRWKWGARPLFLGISYLPSCTLTTDTLLGRAYTYL